MSVFRFKRFELSNERSAMKVGTDGVLLGAAVTLRESDLHILDAGTGTGVIALMLAQRMEGRKGLDIKGIDIDQASAEEASANFRNSPWSDHLSSRNIPLAQSEGPFDLIVSNPPYYDNSLTNPEKRKSTARHTAGEGDERAAGAPMSYRTLIDFAREQLSDDGRLSVILPSDREKDLLRYGRMYGFHPFRIVRIQTTARKAPARIIVEFSRERSLPKEEGLVLQENGSRTDEYNSLVKDFYL